MWLSMANTLFNLKDENIQNIFSDYSLDIDKYGSFLCFLDKERKSKKEEFEWHFSFLIENKDSLKGKMTYTNNLLPIMDVNLLIFEYKHQVSIAKKILEKNNIEFKEVNSKEYSLLDDELFYIKTNIKFKVEKDFQKPKLDKKVYDKIKELEDKYKKEKIWSFYKEGFFNSNLEEQIKTGGRPCHVFDERYYVDDKTNPGFIIYLKYAKVELFYTNDGNYNSDIKFLQERIIALTNICNELNKLGLKTYISTHGNSIAAFK